MRLIKMLLCVLALSLFCGCRDYNEPNMQALVNGVGADMTDDGVRVCVICVNEEEKAPIVAAAEGETFFEAVRKLSESTSKKLYWGHCRAIILGRKLADEYADELFDALLRAQDVYSDIACVALKDGNAEEVINEKAEKEEDLSDWVSDIFANEKNARSFKSARLWQILRQRELTGSFILPTIVYEGEEIALSGGAVISKEGYRGYLNGEQMLLLSLLTEESAGGSIKTLSGPEGSVSLEILGNNIKRRYEDGKIYIEQSCILSPGQVEGRLTNSRMQALAEDYLEKGFYSLVGIAKEEGMGDIFRVFSKTRPKNILSPDILNYEFIISSDVRISNVLGGEK